MFKKVAKIVGIVVLVIIALLIALPFFLEAKIGDIIRSNVNNNIEGTFDFADADLSLISSFPNAEVSLRDISLVNSAPFEGDTLFLGKEVSLTMRISELFNGGDEAISVKRLFVDGAHINILVDKAENANYDIAKETTEAAGSAGEGEGFKFALESYEIRNSKISYNDLAAAMNLEVSEIQHQGKGDLSAEKSELDTETNALVSFRMDSTDYLSKNPVKLDALIGVDLKENKYSFLRNEAFVNQLPLIFEGFVKVNDDSQEVDLTFKTPSSDFKNFLAVIPAEYSKNIENVTTTGDFSVQGVIKGIVDEEHIPTFKIALHSEDASFKYPDLPKSVTHIDIDADIVNTTGISEDTYVDVRKASFMIDEDRFSLVSKITELAGNTRVSAQLVGRINLANLSQAYPMEQDMDLKGILNADISTEFDMAAVENKQYEKTKTSGQLEVRSFQYNSAEMAQPVNLNALSMSFNPQTVTLKELQGTTGKTDFSATGTLTNLLGFVFNDEDVKGTFDLSSNTFSLNDFMVADSPAEKEKGSGDKKAEDTVVTEEQLKIPAFLDCTIRASAKEVLYDNLVLTNVGGTLRIRDQKAILSDMTSSVFGGRLAFNGEVSTKEATPVFAMDLGMENLRIAETFKAIELFDAIAPIAKIIEGKLNSKVSLSGNLKEDFTPVLQSLSGNLLAEILSPDINTENSKILSQLSDKLQFIKLDNLNLQGLKTALSFEDGIVKVKPFTLNYQDIAIDIAGGHTFDQKLDYNATIQVPAKYLGKEVTSLLARLNENELNALTIPVTAQIGGNYTAPVVSTNLTAGVKELTAKLIDFEKQRLINQGKDKARDLIGGILSGSGKTADSARQKDSVKVGVKDVLGGVLGSANSKKDTVSAKPVPKEVKEEQAKEKAKSILGGLLGKKKQDTVKAKKDSVN